MQSRSFGSGVDGHRLNRHFPQRTADPYGNFASIGDKDFFEHAVAILAKYTEVRMAASHLVPNLVVVEPGGHRSQVSIEPVPFRIGRHEENHLVLRDGRTSRQHAQIVYDGSNYVLEDVGSRHGLFVNGRRIKQHKLGKSDTIEFGVPDSYHLIFSPDGSELTRLVESTELISPGALVGSNLGKLRAVLEIGRTLQSSYSMDDVLNSVLDAALAVTGADRGFLFLKDGRELGMRCARDCRCGNLPEESLRVPRRLLAQALNGRSDLLSMSFRPHSGADPGNSIEELELRSAVCVPLVRIRAAPQDTAAPEPETAGLLYMDSRISDRDMAVGNRELLQSLAIEASVIVENARLLQEERGKKKLEEELDIARGIQQGLLPRSLPQTGWLLASGSSVASFQVGGDYFDMIEIDEHRWAALVVDVSGKGVSSALVASLLQGAFLTFADGPIDDKIRRVNRLLSERTEEGKYATIFYCTIDSAGAVQYINAGHCSPMLTSQGEKVQYLEATGVPAGLVDDAEFSVATIQLKPGDRIVIYSDGMTDAQDMEGNFFGRRRLRELVEKDPDASAPELHAHLLAALESFTAGALQSDDVTLLVLQYCPTA
jgi:phosphoserine phosphatase RsbU/P